MKDKELKLEDIEAPHALGGASYILFRYIDPAEGGKNLVKLELRKPRNLFACAEPRLIFLLIDLSENN
jgi:hypothetical protein